MHKGLDKGQASMLGFPSRGEVRLNLTIGRLKTMSNATQQATSVKIGCPVCPGVTFDSSMDLVIHQASKHPELLGGEIASRAILVGLGVIKPSPYHITDFLGGPKQDRAF